MVSKTFIILLFVCILTTAIAVNAQTTSTTYDWKTNTCGSDSTTQVYSNTRHSCITNPCTSPAVFDSSSETCVCPAGQIIYPPGAVPTVSLDGTISSPTCISCSTISHMESRSGIPTCLPCAYDALSTPPTVAFRNLFLYKATKTVTIDTQTWVHGGGDLAAVDGMANTADRVALVASQWNTTTNMCSCPSGFILTDTLASGVPLKAFVCTRCANATNATLSGPSSNFVCEQCGGNGLTQYDSATSSCTCTAINGVLVQRQDQDGGDYCASSVLQSSLLSSGTTGTTTSTPVNVDNSGKSGGAVTSYLMSTFAVSAALSCASRNATACQFLANLCALTLYDMSSAACNLHMRIHRSEGCVGISNCEQPTSVPWLHYLRSSSAVFSQTTLNLRISLRHRSGFVHFLKFILFEYDVYGTLLDRRLLTDELSLCDINSAQAHDFFYIGRKNQVTCNINIRHYLQQIRRNDTTRLYELFLEDSSNNNALVPVPVVIDTTSTGNKIPDSIDSDAVFKSASADQNPVAGAWRRRFFMVDNVVSRTSENSDPAHITYARRVSFMVQLRGSGTSNIYVPIAVIQYASAMTSTLLTNTDFSSGALRNVQTNNTGPSVSHSDAPLFEYRTYFLRSDDDVIKAVKPTVIVLCCVVFATAFFKTYGWMRRQQDLNLGMSTLIRFFIFLCNHFANIFAIYVFLTCGAFYVFFKHQSAVEWLLPLELDYLWGPLYAAFTAKLIVVLFNIIEQTNADYFVIDWERPKTYHGQASVVPLSSSDSAALLQNQSQNQMQQIPQQQNQMQQQMQNLNNSTIPAVSTAGTFASANTSAIFAPAEKSPRQKSHDASGGGSVSMWRSTFVANELNELQVRRSFHVLLVILIVAVFLEGIGYNELARSIPNAELTHGGVDPFVVTEPILRVAIGGFFWIIVSLVLYVIEWQVFYKFVSAHPLQAFADLCSVSNISIMILLEPQWGFYIHGESLHAFADASMEEFQANLQREAQGNMPQRGLGGVQDCQTFEVFVGSYLRHFLYVCYNQLYVEQGKAMNEAQAQANINASQGQQQSEVVVGQHRRCFEFLLGGSGKPRVFTPETLSIKKQINGLMQQSIRSAQKSLMVKFGLHAVMDFPPNIMYMNGPFAGERAGTDLFFLDDATNFGQAFLCGLDFDLFILYGLLYATIDATIFNTFWAMMVVYLMDVVLVWYREKEGTANLGSKTLFDERFFL